MGRVGANLIWYFPDLFFWTSPVSPLEAIILAIRSFRIQGAFSFWTIRTGPRSSTLNFPRNLVPEDTETAMSKAIVLLNVLGSPAIIPWLRLVQNPSISQP